MPDSAQSKKQNKKRSYEQFLKAPGNEQDSANQDHGRIPKKLKLPIDAPKRAVPAFL